MAEANTKQKICGICTKAPSKYCCPRCYILYCSLDCYKSETHSECSENFYRDCVTHELTTYEADDDSQKKMFEILKRMQESDEGEVPEQVDDEIDSDDGNDVELHERLHGLDLNNADAVWNALTDDERNGFKALMNDGDVTSIIPIWEPWWTKRSKKNLVEEVFKSDVVVAEYPILVTVPNISNLIKGQLSPAIKYNITNVLTSYAFVMRYLNGEPNSLEAVLYFFNVCDNLNFNTNFEEPALAVESVVQKLLQCGLVEIEHNTIYVIKYDTFLLLQGPNEENKNYYCQCALSHLLTLLRKAKKNSKLLNAQRNVECTINEGNASKSTDTKTKERFTRKFPDHKTENLPPLDLSKVMKGIKKIEFYLSYLQSCSMEFDFCIQ